MPPLPSSICYLPGSVNLHRISQPTTTTQHFHQRPPTAINATHPHTCTKHAMLPKLWAIFVPDKAKKKKNPLFQSILISFILHEQTSWIWARYQRKAKRYSRLTYALNRRKLIHSKCLSFVGFFFPLNHHFMHAVTRTVGRRTSNIGSPFYASCVSSHYNTLPSFSVPQSPFHHVLTRPLLILCIPRSTHSLLGDC